LTTSTSVFAAQPPDAPPAASAPYRVLVQSSGLVFFNDGRASLLESGLAQGVELPSACRNGTCRACMCRLREGQLHYRIAWPGLSREEKEEGWCLPCVALAQSDLVLDQPLAQTL
jgi:ferredoxin